tara:strand:- start:1803 stop:2561 length:759 start_codon:yes stop_codon:yes gene_type:complete
VFPLLWCLLLFVAVDTAAEAEWRRGTVTRFVDGDTLILDSGETIRLAGINTPEMATDSRPAEPLALEARNALSAQLVDGQLLIEDAPQPSDRYGRTLAYLFRIDGASVQEALLHKGLASAVAIAPNDRYLDRFIRAEQTARRTGRGIWAMKYYAPVPADKVRGGYQFMRAQVSRIEMAKKWFVFSVEKDFVILVRRSAWESEFDYSPDALDQRRIAVRGWFSKKKDRATLVINHPFMLERCGIDPPRLCRDD